MRKVRNNLSHRSSYQSTKEASKFDNYLHKGLNKQKRRDITDKKEKELFDEGKYIEFKKNQNWDRANEALRTYVYKIKQDLEDYHPTEKTTENYIHLKSL